MIKCKICDKICKDNKCLIQHARGKHKISSKAYYDKYLRKSGDSLCKECKSDTIYYGITKGYAGFCSNKCATNSQEYKNGRRKTNLLKYGIECVFQVKEVINKSKQTKLEKYGDENYTNIDKHKRTMLKRYGVETSGEMVNHVDNIKATNLQRYGDENYNNREKFEQTMMQKYNVATSMQFEEFKNKMYISKTGMTIEEYKKTLPEKEKYYRKVKQITRSQPIHLLENYDKPRGTSGTAYQLDHIISKNYGFKNNINPVIIGDISNLQFIPWLENIRKGDKLL